MEDKNRIIIFDTTMRDGEQSPGASMSLEEKIQISRVFDELGIDIIEAGFPIASPGDFEAVTAISKILKKSVPAGLARHTKKDIDACHEALKSAKRFTKNVDTKRLVCIALKSVKKIYEKCRFQDVLVHA